MHFYKFHIGDYVQSTVHLSPMEDITYRRLIDMYYTTEQPIPLETQSVSRRLRLDTQLITEVLEEFFEKREDGYHNDRCDAEIREYQELCQRNQSNGKSGGRPKKTQSVSTGNPVITMAEPSRNPNHKPLTINHKPVKGARLSEEIELSKEWGNWALTEKPDWSNQDVINCFSRFKDYWISKPGKDGIKLDWFATWRNWVRNTK